MKIIGNEEEKKNSEWQSVIFLLKFPIAAEGLCKYCTQSGIQDMNTSSLRLFFRARLKTI